MAEACSGRRWGGLAATLLLVLILLGGCVTEGGTRDRKREAPRSDLRPSQLTPTVTRPRDITGDGRGDELDVIFFLFAYAPDPVSVRVDGSLRVEMLWQGESLKVWNIPPEAIARSVESQSGLNRYALVLLLPRREQVPVFPKVADLVFTFQPTAGGPPLEHHLSVPLEPQ
ncbi:MAG: hypothetical protein ACF8SC_10705 [Phycisphaerales bacterium JB037]